MRIASLTIDGAASSFAMASGFLSNSLVLGLRSIFGSNFWACLKSAIASSILLLLAFAIASLTIDGAASSFARASASCSILSLVSGLRSTSAFNSCACLNNAIAPLISFLFAFAIAF